MELDIFGHAPSDSLCACGRSAFFLARARAHPAHCWTELKFCGPCLRAARQDATLIRKDGSRVPSRVAIQAARRAALPSREAIGLPVPLAAAELHRIRMDHLCIVARAHGCEARPGSSAGTLDVRRHRTRTWETIEATRAALRAWLR